MTSDSQATVDLYWLPLGAGGHSVRLNGRLYEAVVAWRQKRGRQDLYHSALVVTVPAGRFVIEQAWPIPDADGPRRGVVTEGPVGTRSAGWLRALRYEIRRWRDGVIPDVDEAVESPQRLTADPVLAQRVLDLVPEAPTPVWGRDELGVGEMWNSNSLISWLIARSGVGVDAVHPPAGGSAPGWHAGVVAARREEPPSGDVGATSCQPRSRCRGSRAGGSLPAGRVYVPRAWRARRQGGYQLFTRAMRSRRRTRTRASTAT
jgi:hypothetical protein